MHSVETPFSLSHQIVSRETFIPTPAWLGIVRVRALGRGVLMVAGGVLAVKLRGLTDTSLQRGTRVGIRSLTTHRLGRPRRSFCCLTGQAPPQPGRWSGHGFGNGHPTGASAVPRMHVSRETLDHDRGGYT
jgi:hypothetical protein